ncbi:MAG: hypothetical protein ACJ8DI_08340 [Ktedonobacteraceae bacterium]
MKLYKPTRHKPPFGRGYEGATPWGFTPANAPYEQSYITFDDLPGKRYWTWGMFATLERVSQEVIAELRGDGWEPRETATVTAFFLLENQFGQTLIVSEQSGHWSEWARAEDIRHAQAYPVFLTYETGVEDEPDFLPPDMVMGACALVNDGATWRRYTIDELGEAGQPLFRQIREGMMLFPPDADPGAAETRQRAEQRIDRWEATHTAAQQLAILYWNLHQERRATKASPRQGLPELTSAHRTRIPTLASFHSLTQSFGPAIRHADWNQERAGTLELLTPSGSILRVIGTNATENIMLHHYVTDMLGPEGLKHLLILLDAYYVQTGGLEHKVDARVSLRQLLLRLGKGSKADELGEQSKLMHTILYLASTYIREQPGARQASSTGKSKPPPLARQRKSRRAAKNYSPLLVIERLKAGLDGTITIPEEVEYHLGYEFFEALFGTKQQFFLVPTAQLLRYHADRQHHELLLAFYLSNALIAWVGPFSIPFPVLLQQSALHSQQDLDHGHDRLRDASRVLRAIEQLERDELIVRSPHTQIDTALAAELVQTERRRDEKRKAGGEAAKKKRRDPQDLTEDDLAEATFERMETTLLYLQRLPDDQLRQKHRVALQQLLDERLHERVEFAPGRFLQEQVRQQAAQRQATETELKQRPEGYPSPGQKRAVIIESEAYVREDDQAQGSQRHGNKREG